MTAPDVVAALTPVVEALEDLGVRYHVGGSVASSIQGMARATLDVDIVADLDLRRAAAFVRRLAGLYYVDEDAVRDAIRRQASFNCIHLTTMLKVDVFVRKTRLYDAQAFDRMTEDTLEPDAPSRTFFVAAPEDTILNKLEWYRLGAGVSDRQWWDVLGVLKVQAGRLDLGYLRHWARELGVLDLLERALSEAGDG